MKKRSKLGRNYPTCRMSCGICATNKFSLPYRLGVALFDLEESDKSKYTLDSIAKRFKTVTYQEIMALYAEVQETIKFYEGITQNVN